MTRLEGDAAVGACDVLVVEDSDIDYLALTRALRRSRPDLRVGRSADGAGALARLIGEGRPPLPALVLLDLNLPGTDGREVLRRLRGTIDLSRLPIVVLTTSSNPQDVQECYAAGANGYLFKPIDTALFEATVRGAVDYWMSAAYQDEPSETD